MDLFNIVEGHYKELVGNNQALYEERIKICKDCKLYTDDKILGDICDRNKWLNVYTNEVYTDEKENLINGCGCRLNAKARLKQATCPIHKW